MNRLALLPLLFLAGCGGNEAAAQDSGARTVTVPAAAPIQIAPVAAKSRAITKTHSVTRDKQGEVISRTETHTETEIGPGDGPDE